MSQTMVEIGRGALLSARWTLGQGQTNQFRFVWSPVTQEWLDWDEGGRVGEEPTKNAPQDLTGWGARLQIRSKPGEQFEPWLTLTDTPGAAGGIALGADGEILGTVEPGATSAWGTARKSGVFDLKLISPDGVVVTFARGPVVVEHEITLDEESA